MSASGDWEGMSSRAYQALQDIPSRANQGEKECLPELIKTVDRGLTIYTLYLTGVRLAKSYVCQHLVHHQRLVNFPIKGARMMGQHSTVAHTVHERFACML